MGKILKAILCIALVLAISITASCLTLGPSEACNEICGNIGLQLLIRDQDEDYGQRVTNTWTAANLEPGQAIPFAGSFAQLKEQGFLPAEQMQISLTYSLQQPTKGSPLVTADAMAKMLILTKLSYSGTGWIVDLLTGQATGSPPHPARYRSGDWAISDIDKDGQLTFFDFKNSRLRNLPAPLPSFCSLGTTRMLMSLQFSSSAGNEFMGAKLSFQITYTISL